MRDITTRLEMVEFIHKTILDTPGPNPLLMPIALTDVFMFTCALLRENQPLGFLGDERPLDINDLCMCPILAAPAVISFVSNIFELGTVGEPVAIPVIARAFLSSMNLPLNEFVVQKRGGNAYLRSSKDSYFVSFHVSWNVLIEPGSDLRPWSTQRIRDEGRLRIPPIEVGSEASEARLS